MSPDGIRELIEKRCPKAVLSGELDLSEPYLEIEASRMREVALVLRDELGFDRLLIAAGIDFEGWDEKGRGKHRAIAQYGEDGKVQAVTEPATGDLGMSYHLENLSANTRFVLKVRIERENPEVASVSSVWPTALWHEREAYDMYGIEFEGHPDLRRLLLPEDWEGWPLRKDYEMPKEWQGVPLEGLPLAVREQKGAEEE
jgi:NADH-quinone oxidoreductase subunit C